MANSYAMAMDATRDAVTERARRYKWLVIAVALGSVASVAAGFALRHLLWPALLALLPPIVIGYFAMDLRLVFQWRTTAVTAWARGDLRLDLLASTLRTMPGIPPSTVDGMVATLPTWSDTTPAAAREALGAAQALVGVLGEQSLWLRAVGWAVAASTVLTAAVTRNASWLLPSVALPLLVGGWYAWARHCVLRSALRVALECATASSGTSNHTPPPEPNWQGVPAFCMRAWQAAAQMRATGKAALGVR